MADRGVRTDCVGTWDSALPIGIGLDRTCSDGEAFTADRRSLMQRANTFSITKRRGVAVAKVAMTVLRDLSGTGSSRAKAAKPPVSQIKMHLFTQTVFLATTEAVTHDQHANDQGRIHLGTTCVTVVRRQSSDRKT